MLSKLRHRQDSCLPAADKTNRRTHYTLIMARSYAVHTRVTVRCRAPSTEMAADDLIESHCDIALARFASLGSPTCSGGRSKHTFAGRAYSERQISWSPTGQPMTSSTHGQRFTYFARAIACWPNCTRSEDIYSCSWRRCRRVIAAGR